MSKTSLQGSANAAELSSPPTIPARPVAGAIRDGGSRWVRSALAVFGKEARAEWRTRQALGTITLFAVTTLTALAYLLATKSVGSDVKAALLWVVLLFSAMSGLARVFIREEDLGTADALRLTAPATAVYAGKLFFNAALLAVIECIATPLFFGMLSVKTGHVAYGLLIGVLLLGGIGLASASTFVAALVAQAPGGGVRGSLFFVAAFPALVPALLAAAGGTLAALAPNAVSPATGPNSLIVLASYDAVVIAGSFLLFGLVWSES